MNAIWNQDAEMSALASMFLSPVAMDELLAMLEPEDFFAPSHRAIFESIRTLAALGRPIDAVILRDELTRRGQYRQIGGDDYLIQIGDFVPSPANSGWYGELVLESAARRRMLEAALAVQHLIAHPNGLSPADQIEKAESLVLEASKRKSGCDFSSSGALAGQLVEEVENMLAVGAPNAGLPTGFPDLDRVLNGMMPGDLFVLAARPGMGKTCLAMDIARRVAALGTGAVAFFSLEMSETQMMRRLLCSVAGLTSSQIRSPEFMAGDGRSRLKKAAESVSALPLFVSGLTEMTATEIRRRCARLRATQGALSLVVVDYLQLLRPSWQSDNRTQEVSDISRSLKVLAKNLDVTVLALSQLSRDVEKRSVKRPVMSDLRESGSIEADADVVAMLYNPAYYTHSDPEPLQPVEVRVVKHRSGEPGTAVLGFEPAFVRFTSLPPQAVAAYLRGVAK